MAEIERAVIEDLGGEAECSEVLLALVHDLSFAVTLRDLLSAHLAAVGPLTKAGKRRAALTSWQQTSARVEALARMIGTQRRPVEVPSLEQYIREKAAKREAASAETAEPDDASEAPPLRRRPAPLPGVIPEHELTPDERTPRRGCPDLLA